MTKAYALVFRENEEVDVEMIQHVMERVPKDYVCSIHQQEGRKVLFYYKPIEAPVDLDAPIVCDFGMPEVFYVTRPKA